MTEARGDRPATPNEAATPEGRIRMALELAEVGEQMQRMRLRRENPDWDADAVEAAMIRWMQHRPGAPHGDYPGPASTRVIEDRP